MSNPRLNPNHVRWVEVTLAHVDELLQRVERYTGERASPFVRERADVTETEATLLRAMVARARARMIAAMDQLGIPRPVPRLSARWGIETTLRYVEIALAELDERTLGGYGGIAPADAAEVAVLAADLRDVMALGRSLLHPREGERLHERLSAVPGAVGDFLRAAEDVSREHGLVEARPLIAAAAERATAATVDVGVFGRVSAGKSSLINAFLGAPVLPVGATPVTAVPLHIVHGDPGVTATYFDGRTEHLPLEQLAELATETGNAENRRGVQSLQVATRLVPDGLALLDTPGVGSLSQSGPALAYASLPRCDLGVVLVPAGTPIGRDEIALVTGFRDAGIPVEVLLSKSDMLTADERAASLEYVTRELQRTVGAHAPPVHAVAVVGVGRALFEEWRDRVLRPRIDDRRASADAALQRRLQALLQILSAGMSGRGAGASGSDQQRLQAKLDATKAIGQAVDALERSARATLQRAVDAAVKAWGADGDAVDAVRGVLRDQASAALAKVRACADSVAAEPMTDDDEGGGRMPPLFDPPFLDALPIEGRPGVLDRLAPHARASRRLAVLWRPLDDAYSTFAQRIRVWALERLQANVERAAALGVGGAAGTAPALLPLAEMLRQMGMSSMPPASSQTGGS